MNDDVLVKAEGVSKKFCRSLKRSLWYGVQDVRRELLGGTAQPDVLRKNEFWAVNDVSFELKRGECLGLIGPNGAGKSTLLKMLNGLIKPDRGRISIKGRVGALIELGAGFNPILSARENIYINGSVLGFSEQEIKRKFDSIVDFAEIEDFLDSPIQHFSSGMQVRLGFAVAAQLEPEVLIIDEVLAVGDANFRMKCINQISRIARNSATIFVSHSMPMIARLVSSILVVDHGRVIHSGLDVPAGIEKYLRGVSFNEDVEVSDFFHLADFIFNSNTQTDPQTELTVQFGQEANIEFVFRTLRISPDFIVDVAFIDMEGKPVAQCLSLFSDFFISNSSETFRLSLDITAVNLTPGKYLLQIKFVEKLDGDRRGEVLYQKRGVAVLEVKGVPYGWAPVQLSGDWSYEAKY